MSTRDEPDAHDPLNALAAAWRVVEPPEPTASLDAPDQETRATVEWLRNAWNASTPPVPALPWRLRGRPLVRRIAPWLAAAATLLLALRLLLPVTERTAIPQSLESSPPPSNPTPTALVATVVLRDRMEMRAGDVRVILFTPIASKEIER